MRLSDGAPNIAVGVAPSSLGLAQKDGEANTQKQRNRSNETLWSERLEGVSPDCSTAESFQFVPSEGQPVLPSSCNLNLFFVFCLCSFRVCRWNHALQSAQKCDQYVREQILSR